MEQIIYVLLLFIFLNCVMKLSLWQWWQRIIYSLVLGGFAYWSMDYAMLHSKTRIADYLQKTAVLQNMAIIVTIESVFCLAFTLTYLQNDDHTIRNKWWAKVLFWYPGLLMFPLVFYLLTQTLFAAVGVDFSLTAWLFAGAVVLLLPLIAEGFRFLLPERDHRVEVHLLLSLFICILGLIATENGKIVYAVKEHPVDWLGLTFTLGGFALLFGLGWLLSRYRWFFRKS